MPRLAHLPLLSKEDKCILPVADLGKIPVLHSVVCDSHNAQSLHPLCPLPRMVVRTIVGPCT